MMIRRVLNFGLWVNNIKSLSWRNLICRAFAVEFYRAERQGSFAPQSRKGRNNLAATT